MPEDSTLFQILLEAGIIIGVLGGIIIIYWAKIAKVTPMQLLKKIFSAKLFSSGETDAKKPQEEVQQTWQEHRTIM